MAIILSETALLTFHNMCSLRSLPSNSFSRVSLLASLVISELISEILGTGSISLWLSLGMHFFDISLLNFFPQMPNFKALRVLRVFKPLRSIKSIPSTILFKLGMRRLVSSLLKSLPNLFNVVIFLLFLFILFGILGIQVFRLKQYQRCRVTSHPENGQW